jgi:hypothetical protein
MMHAGMGIAFAKDAVDDLTPWSSATKVKDALKVFLQRVRQNSMPGYEGAALESLGLVTHTWYPQLVRVVTDQLLALDADATEFFWHGVGRSMYFSPMYMLPGLSPWEAADHEPPDDTARRNARRASRAFTIVNVRQPKIAAHFLRTGPIASEQNAYTNGVHSTLIMAGEMVPGHRMCPTSAGISRIPTRRPGKYWTIHKGDRYRGSLKAHHRLGEVFRYYDRCNCRGFDL